MKNIITIFFVVLAISCLSCASHDNVQSIGKKEIIKIDRDSCLVWNLPVTAFEVEQPNSYDAIFHYKDSYLNLSKTEDGIIVQEISFGKCENLTTKKDLEKYTNVADSLLSTQDIFQKQFIGYKSIEGKNLFQLNGTFNFDKYNVEQYKGDYNMLLVLIPSDKQPNGVSMTILTKANKDTSQLNQEYREVFKSLKFQK